MPGACLERGEGGEDGRIVAEPGGVRFSREGAPIELVDLAGPAAPEAVPVPPARLPGEPGREPPVGVVDGPLPPLEERQRRSGHLRGAEAGVHRHGREPGGRQRLLHPERGERIDEGARVAYEEETGAGVARRVVGGRGARPRRTRAGGSPEEAGDVRRLGQLGRVRPGDGAAPLQRREPRVHHRREVADAPRYGHRPRPAVLVALDEGVRLVVESPSRPPAPRRRRAPASTGPAPAAAARAWRPRRSGPCSRGPTGPRASGRPRSGPWKTVASRRDPAPGRSRPSNPADVGAFQDTRAGCPRQSEEDALQVTLDHLIASRTVAEALAPGLRAVPPDRVARRADEARGLHRGPDPEEVEEPVDARGERLGERRSGRGTREEDHRAPPRRKEPCGGCTGGATAENRDVDGAGPTPRGGGTPGARFRRGGLPHPGGNGPPAGRRPRRIEVRGAGDAGARGPPRPGLTQPERSARACHDPGNPRHNNGMEIMP